MNQTDFKVNSIFILVYSIGLLLFSDGVMAQESEPTQEKTISKAKLEEPDTRGYIVNVGDKVDKFELTLDDGSVVKSKKWKGKVVMLQFTASWCGVCRKEMPIIEEEIWSELKDNDDFVLIGVDRDEPLETVLKFKEQTGISYPLALDPGAEIYQLFAAKKSGVTRNIIINQDGEIAYLTRLFEREEFDEMKAEIWKLLKLN